MVDPTKIHQFLIKSQICLTERSHCVHGLVWRHFLLFYFWNFFFMNFIFFIFGTFVRVNLLFNDARRLGTVVTLRVDTYTEVYMSNVRFQTSITLPRQKKKKNLFISERLRMKKCAYGKYFEICMDMIDVTQRYLNSSQPANTPPKTL